MGVCFVHAHVPTYPQAKVEKEEHVEGHVDLQREIFVEVLAGFYRTGKEREYINVTIFKKNNFLYVRCLI